MLVLLRWPTGALMHCCTSALLLSVPLPWSASLEALKAAFSPARPAWPCTRPPRGPWWLCSAAGLCRALLLLLVRVPLFFELCTQEALCAGELIYLDQKTNKNGLK